MPNIPAPDVDPDEVPDWLMPMLNQQYAGVTADLPLIEDTVSYRLAVVDPLLFSGNRPTAEQLAVRNELGYPVQLGQNASETDRAGSVVVVRETNGGFLANLDPDADPNTVHSTSIFPFFQSENPAELREVADLVQKVHDYTLETTSNEVSAAQAMVSAANDLGTRLGFVDPNAPQFAEAYGSMIDPTVDQFEVRPLREVLVDLRQAEPLLAEEALEEQDWSWLKEANMDMDR